MGEGMRWCGGGDGKWGGGEDELVLGRGIGNGVGVDVWESDGRWYTERR